MEYLDVLDGLNHIGLILTIQLGVTVIIIGMIGVLLFFKD